MAEMDKMYHILEDMLECTVRGDKARVKELNYSYEDLAERVYHKSRTALEIEYDGCRVSCVTALSMPNMRDELISDAKERFSKIPKPE